MESLTEQDVESDIETRPPTYPTIYLDELWNVVGFNEVAVRLLRPSGDPNWFDSTGTLHVFDILCSRRGKAMLSSGHEESLERTVLCFRAHVEQGSTHKQNFEAVWNRLTNDYPIIGKARSARLSDGATKRAYNDGKKLVSGEPVYACHITASLDIMNATQSELHFVCEIARNDSDLENPSAYRVVLLPDNELTEVAVMLNQIQQHTRELQSSYQRPPATERLADVSLYALYAVVSAGLQGVASPERYNPVDCFREVFHNLSRELSLGSPECNIQTLASTSDSWKWQSSRTRRRRPINKVHATKLDRFIRTQHDAIIDFMATGKPLRHMAEGHSLSGSLLDVQPTTNLSKESLRIRNEVREAMGMSALAKYRRNDTPSINQGEESMRIRDEVREARDVSALAKYRTQPAHIGEERPRR